MPLNRPLLLIDIDGVLSVFGFDPQRPPDGQFVTVDGIIHYLSSVAGKHLLDLAEHFELVWCSGWEEKADEYLPLALGLPVGLPHLSFGLHNDGKERHWKLGAIDRFAGSDRPLAWIDDAHDDSCQAWGETRDGPTLLIATDPAVGLTAEHVTTLVAWAGALNGGR
jgi:hypothetical protein